MAADRLILVLAVAFAVPLLTLALASRMRRPLSEFEWRLRKMRADLLVVQITLADHLTPAFKRAAEAIAHLGRAFAEAGLGPTDIDREAQ